MADVAPPVADEPMAAAAPAEADAEAAAAAAAPAADAADAPAAAPARIIIDSSQGAVSGGVSGRELAKRIKTFSDGSNIWTRKLDAETDAPEAKARRRAELNDDVGCDFGDCAYNVRCPAKDSCVEGGDCRCKSDAFDAA